MQGYLDKDDPDQIKGDDRQHLRSFAQYFNKALNFRYFGFGKIFVNCTKLLQNWFSI